MRYVFKKGEFYWYRRRVPSEASHLDKRPQVKLSLRTKDYKSAILKADIYNQQMERFWAALILSGNACGLEEKYRAAVKLAKSQGFAYATNLQLSTGPLNEIIARLSSPIENEESAAALLGGIEQPKLLLSEAIERYWDLTVDRITGKSDAQIRKWRNPRQSAITNFIDLRGNKAIQDIDRKDMLAFRQWWSERINSGYNSDTANKQMSHIGDIVTTVGKLAQLTINEAVFRNLRFKVTVSQRAPFEASYVQTVLLSGLDGMSSDAKAVVEILAETGARPTEIIGLRAEDIVVDADIPYIWIQRNLKTPQSKRQIPLVGRALTAIRAYPNGFNRWSNTDSFTSAVGKYLRENNLCPSPQHSLYSLRHTFKDRLRDAEAPQEIIDELMGHRKQGVPYGRGHLLARKHEWLQRIAFDQ